MKIRIRMKEYTSITVLRIITHKKGMDAYVKGFTPLHR